MLAKRFCDIAFVGTVRNRKATCSFRPNFEPLENRIALHGSPVHAASAHIAYPAVDVGAAGTQVLNIMGTSIQQYGILQVQLDARAAKLQKQSRATQQKNAKSAQTLNRHFVTGENRRYQQVLAIANTVSGSPDFTALMQLEQQVHSEAV